MGITLIVIAVLLIGALLFKAPVIFCFIAELLEDFLD